MPLFSPYMLVTIPHKELIVASVLEGFSYLITRMRTETSSFFADSDQQVYEENAQVRWKAKLQKENSMKTSTKDQVEGSFHEIKGKVKEAAGKLSDNQNLEDEGLGEKITGKVQKKVGQVEKVLEK